MTMTKKTKSNLVAALDLGTSKVCCFIALFQNDAPPRVVGIGHVKNKGMKNGVVSNIDEVEMSILSAVNGAEQLAGSRIQSVLINLSGGAAQSHTTLAEVPIDGRAIISEDIRQVMEQGYQPETNGVAHDVIHFIPTGFIVDGCKGIKEPRGMYAAKLGASLHTVTASAAAIKNIKSCVNRAMLDVDDVVLSIYASGLATLVEDELELGALVIDMGGGMTKFGVFADGHLLYADSVPFGGDHITHDIATCMGTSLGHAERMKTLYGSAIRSTTDDKLAIEVPQMGDTSQNHTVPMPKSLLVDIINARVVEIFELVRQKLQLSGTYHIAGRTAVLTGGSAQLIGIGPIAGDVLGKAVRIGKPLKVNGLAEATAGPAFATCAGLLLYKANPLHSNRYEQLLSGGDDSGLLGRLGQWLNSF